MNKKTLEVVGCMFKFAKNLAQEVGGGGGLGLGGNVKEIERFIIEETLDQLQKKKKNWKNNNFFL